MQTVTLWMGPKRPWQRLQVVKRHHQSLEDRPRGSGASLALWLLPLVSSAWQWDWARRQQPGWHLSWAQSREIGRLHIVAHVPRTLVTAELGALDCLTGSCEAGDPDEGLLLMLEQKGQVLCPHSAPWPDLFTDLCPISLILYSHAWWLVPSSSRAPCAYSDCHQGTGMELAEAQAAPHSWV